MVPRGLRPLRPLLALAAALAPSVRSLGSDPVAVTWRISIAWEDESCDSVCASSGELCTEACWPTTASGLVAATNHPRLADTCFAVQGGTPEAWYPAKDPENTICYWDVGTHSGSRCGVAPQTPPDLADQGRFWRRLCPCLNSTQELYARYFGTECGVGGHATQPVPGSSGSSGSSPTPPPPAAQAPQAPAQQAPAAQAPQAPQATAAPTPSPMRRRPGSVTPVSAAFAYPVTASSCSQLCVEGFSSQDLHLNGAYQRFDAENLFSHWSGSGYWLFQGDDGRWRFAEVPAEIEVASGTLPAQAGTVVPSSDYFMTATGGDQVRFGCCPGYSASALSGPTAPSGSGGSGNGDATSGRDGATIGITLGILGGLAVVGIGGIALYKWRPRRAADLKEGRARAYQTMDPETSRQGSKGGSPTQESAPTNTGAGASPGGGAAFPGAASPAAAGTPGAGPARPARLSGLQGQALQPFPGAPPPRGATTPSGGAEARMASTGRAGSWRGGPDAGPEAPGLGPAPPRAAAAPQEEDQAAAAVAAVLGRQLPQASSTVREGPVTPWWGGAGAASGSGLPDLYEGLEVRLKGLVAQPTWNGTEGMIEALDLAKGQVQVRLPDGRVKAVRMENVEDAARPPAPTPMSRTQGPGFQRAATGLGSGAPGPALPGASGTLGRAQSWRQGGGGVGGGGRAQQGGFGAAAQRPADAGGAAGGRLPPLQGGAAAGPGPSRGAAPPQMPPPPPVPGLGSLPGQPPTASRPRAAPGREAASPSARGAGASPQARGGAGASASPERPRPQQRGPAQQQQQQQQRSPPMAQQPQSGRPAPANASAASRGTALEDDLLRAQRSVQAQLATVQARLSQGLR